MWQQFVELLNGMCGDARQDVAEPLEWINLDEFAGGNEASQDGHSVPAAVTAEKCPVISANGDATDRTFRVVVVDG